MTAPQRTCFAQNQIERDIAAQLHKCRRPIVRG